MRGERLEERESLGKLSGCNFKFKFKQDHLSQAPSDDHLHRSRLEVLKYWFLLEQEHVKALSRDNFSQLDLAFARIDFLSWVINK